MPWFSETRKIAQVAIAVSNSVGAGVSVSLNCYQENECIYFGNQSFYR